jgi:hypothetical protein
LENITELINNQYVILLIGLLLVMAAWYKEIINIIKKIFVYNIKLLEKTKPILYKKRVVEIETNDLSIIINKIEQIVKMLESKNLKESSSLVKNVMIEITKEYINKNSEEKD